MNKRIKELAKEAGAGEWGDSVVPAMMDIEKFAELIVKELVSKIEVEGCDFWYNEINNYGRIKVRFFVGGNPERMCGEEIVRKYVNGMQPSGFYRLNDEFVKHLMESITPGDEE